MSFFFVSGGLRLHEVADTVKRLQPDHSPTEKLVIGSIALAFAEQIA